MFRVVSIYQPCANNQGVFAVHSQHKEHLQSINDDRPPRQAWIEDFEQELSEWLAAGNQIVVAGDVNESEVWKDWKRKFVFYLKATKAMAEDGSVKGAILLAHVGDTALKIYDQFTFAPGTEAEEGVEGAAAVAPEDPEDYETILAKFDEYFSGRKRDRRVQHRVYFWGHLQRGKNQTLAEYAREVAEAAQKCQYSEAIREELIRDKLMACCKDNAALDALMDALVQKQLGSFTATIRLLGLLKKRTKAIQDFVKR